MPGSTIRRAFRVKGIVQGVGFRPHVYGLASRSGLAGFVRNDLQGVSIEVEGAPEAVLAFQHDLVKDLPPLARVTEMSFETKAPLGEARFRIENTFARGEAAVFIPPDAATCADCLRELFDPRNRRFRYPFINCMNCGPRLTIVTEPPYDRENTTMASFPMCTECRAEYDDPLDRRFHAQPIACARCGPRLSLEGAGHARTSSNDILETVTEWLQSGRIVALKGIGGYHLACDATSETAVARLRERKGRGEKPFAVMAASVDEARALAQVSPEQAALLASTARPIVLLRASPGSSIARSVAPGTALLGVMLPYAPLHHLVARALGRPLVMTSGNRAEDPILHEDALAREQLRGIADLFLGHDRPIHVPCDDSVVRFDRDVAIPIRRSRGFAPAPQELPLPLARPTLALGGHLKATFALGTEEGAFLSHHLGDLDSHASQCAYAAAVDHYLALFRTDPERVVHDLHPDYASTRYAEEQASGTAELLGVQHHHAHMAACMAENGLREDAIGVVWDGAGLGHDGCIWGGEFLVGGYASVERAAHWAYVSMPGGEVAIHEPWRMALSHLTAAGLDPGPLESRIDRRVLEVTREMCVRGIRSPLTSSVGRLFDAIASLVGAQDRVSYEGQAAVLLEALAACQAEDGAYPCDVPDDGPLVIDPRSLVRGVIEDLERSVSAARIARRFHTTLVNVIVDVCERLRAAHDLDRVVLSGGVFVNRILAEEAPARLRQRGFRVHTHRIFPPNDGCLSLGQLAVVAGLDALGAGRR